MELVSQAGDSYLSESSLSCYSSVPSFAANCSLTAAYYLESVDHVPIPAVCRSTPDIKC